MSVCEGSMNKTGIVNKIAAEVGMQQNVVRQVVRMALDGIIDCIASEGGLELRDFGVFAVRTRKPRKARNPRTGAPAMVPERKVVTFKPGKTVKARIAATMIERSASSAKIQA